MILELDDKEKDLLKELLSLDMDKIGFNNEEDDILLGVLDKIKYEEKPKHNIVEYSDVYNYMDNIFWSKDENGNLRFPRVSGGFPSKKILIGETREYFKDKDVRDDLEDCLSDAYVEMRGEYLEFFED